MASSSIIQIMKIERQLSPTLVSSGSVGQRKSKSMANNIIPGSRDHKSYSRSIRAINSIEFWQHITRKKIQSLKMLSVSKKRPFRYKNLGVSSFSQRPETILNQHRLSCKVSLTEPSQVSIINLQQQDVGGSDGQNTSILKFTNPYCGYERLRNHSQRSIDTSTRTFIPTNDKCMQSNSETLLKANSKNHKKSGHKQSANLHLNIRLRQYLHRDKKQNKRPEISEINDIRINQQNNHQSKNQAYIQSVGEQKIRANRKLKLPKMVPTNKRKSQANKPKQQQRANYSISGWKSPQCDDAVY